MSAFVREVLSRHIQHRIIGRRRKYGPCRQRRLGLDCLEISDTYCRSAPLCIILFPDPSRHLPGSFCSPREANSIPPEESAPPSPADTGSRLSGSISYSRPTRPLDAGIFFTRSRVVDAVPMCLTDPNYIPPSKKPAPDRQ